MEKSVASKITEIRLRRNSYMLVVIKNTSYFVDYNGDLYETCQNHCVKVNEEDFDKVFMSMCGYSFHSKTEELKNGYLTLDCGARIGVASTAVYDNDSFVSVKNISSLNIRIPREVKSCAKDVVNCLYVNSFPSIIVAGKPNSGKTTLLRDISRSLSSGFNNRYRKITIVDERQELGGAGGFLDLGINTDVLTCFEKPKGIELAARTLSPEMIICDEVSTLNEVEAIKFGFRSGIKFALSVHAESKSELAEKPVINALLSTGEFSFIVLLEDYSYKAQIIEASEVLCETDGIVNSDSFNNINRYSFI